MGGWLVIVVTLIYLGVAVEQFFKGFTGMGMMFAGYAFANVGVLLAMRG